METLPFEQPPSHTFEWSHDESPSAAIVRAVATASGEDPTDMEPLYTAIDPEALDALFFPTHIATARTTGVVEFCFSGYRVRIDAAGKGQIFEQD